MRWKRIGIHVALWVLTAGLLIAVFTTASVAFGDALLYAIEVCTAGFLFDSQERKGTKNYDR